MKLLAILLCSFFIITAAAKDGAPQHPIISKMIDGHLVNSRGEAVAFDTVQEKPYILMYFSAAWCGPCQVFTPRLLDFYNKQGDERDFELIFVSGDRSADAMQAYMEKAEMPWPAITWGHESIAALSQGLGGPSIPALALLDEQDRLVLHSSMGQDGRVNHMSQQRIGVDGVLAIYEQMKKLDKSKAIEAAAAKSDGNFSILQAAFAGQLTTANKDAYDAKQLNSKQYVGVYFTASWCGPCHAFTPELTKFYAQHGGGTDIEIVLVSSDQNADAMYAYMQDKNMPWLASEHHGMGANYLTQKHGGKGIPNLVFFDADGKVVAESFRGDEYIGAQAALETMTALLAEQNGQ